jgi:hypothetical protein
MVATLTTFDPNGELAITDARPLANWYLIKHRFRSTVSSRQPTRRSKAEDPNAYVFLAITGLRTVVRSPEPLGVSD